MKIKTTDWVHLILIEKGHKYNKKTQHLSYNSSTKAEICVTSTGQHHLRELKVDGQVEIS
jgi:hypothetical protein